MMKFLQFLKSLLWAPTSVEQVVEPELKGEAVVVKKKAPAKKKK
jgi:hypothetical protein